MATITANIGAGDWSVNGTWVGSVQPDATSDVVIPASASVNIPTATTVLGRSVTVQTSGTLIFATATSVLTIGDATSGAGNVAFSNAGTITVTGIGTINFISSSATPQTVTTGGQTLPICTFNSVGTTTFSVTDNLTSSGAITVPKGTFTATTQNVSGTTFTSSNGTTVNMGSGAWTFSGTTGNVFATGATCVLNCGTSTLYITSTSSSIKNINPSGDALFDIVVTPGGTGAVGFPGSSSTIHSLKMSAPGPKTFQFAVGQTFTFTGGTDCFPSGTPGNIITIVSSSSGTPATLSKASGQVICDYISIKDSTATGGASWFAGSHSVNVSGNTGWQFTAATIGMWPVTA